MKRQSPKKHIRCLERRLGHLETRVATSSKDLSYDKAEIAALKWAIALARQMFPEPTEVQELEAKDSQVFENEGSA